VVPAHRLTVTERVVIVPCHGMSTSQAYEVAKRKLKDEGLVSLQLNDARVDRDTVPPIDTFILKIDVASEAQVVR
jgi:hypothetical protein